MDSNLGAEQSPFVARALAIVAVLAGGLVLVGAGLWYAAGPQPTEPNGGARTQLPKGPRPVDPATVGVHPDAHSARQSPALAARASVVVSLVDVAGAPVAGASVVASGSPPPVVTVLETGARVEGVPPFRITATAPNYLDPVPVTIPDATVAEAKLILRRSVSSALRSKVLKKESAVFVAYVDTAPPVARTVHFDEQGRANLEGVPEGPMECYLGSAASLSLRSSIDIRAGQEIELDLRDRPVGSLRVRPPGAVARVEVRAPAVPWPAKSDHPAPSLVLKHSSRDGEDWVFDRVPVGKVIAEGFTADGGTRYRAEVAITLGSASQTTLALVEEK